MVLQKYEVWSDPDDDSVLLTTSHGRAEQQAKGLLSKNAALLYAIEAHTLEEASAIHHLRQGWEPYVPMGEAKPCPKCNAHYFPMGSGQCWRCGLV